MSSEVNLVLNSDLIRDFLNNRLYSNVTSYLNEHFSIVLDSSGEPKRFIITEEHITLLGTILTDSDDATVFKEVFKALRNCVVKSTPQTQELVLENEAILNYAGQTLLRLEDDCKVVLQFLINCVVNNYKNAVKVWNLLESQILRLMKDPTHSYYAAALCYNILYLHKGVVLSVAHYETVLELCHSSEQNEYYYFLLELFLQDINFYIVFHQINPLHRVTALNYIQVQASNTFHLNPISITHLITQFKKKSDCILKTVTSYVEQIEPEEVVLLLDIISTLSADEKHLQRIQSDRSLLINCVFLLKSIQDIGRSSSNNFTPIEKLGNAEAANSHPIFGFKANLIKLLGNMCWKNIDNQNQFRELDGIPILLDCTNIDARNPFITQWCVLAIRNLCENNLENQAVIAATSKKGVIESSTLREMGITLNDDGSHKIGIVPLIK